MPSVLIELLHDWSIPTMLLSIRLLPGSITLTATMSAASTTTNADLRMVLMTLPTLRARLTVHTPPALAPGFFFPISSLRYSRRRGTFPAVIQNQMGR